jgi:hypothetical protein
MAMTKHCLVEGCKHPKTHVTKGHCCGTCDHFGHGQLECNKPQHKVVLAQYNNTLPSHLQCTLSSCRYPQYHTNAGHQCTMCSKFGHSMPNCPSTSHKYALNKFISIVSCNSSTDTINLSHKALKKFGDTDGKIYTEVYHGMGCVMFFRRKSIYGDIEYIFIHSDSWGQYGKGEQLDHTPYYNQFKYGYTKV